MDVQTAQGVTVFDNQQRRNEVNTVRLKYRFEAGAKLVSWRMQRKIHCTRESTKKRSQSNWITCFLRVTVDCKVLTMTETKTGSTCATMALARGSGDRYAVHALKQMIDEVGDPEANVQTDSEGAGRRSRSSGGSTQIRG